MPRNERLLSVEAISPTTPATPQLIDGRSNSFASASDRSSFDSVAIDTPSWIPLQALQQRADQDIKQECLTRINAEISNLKVALEKDSKALLTPGRMLKEKIQLLFLTTLKETLEATPIVEKTRIAEVLGKLQTHYYNNAFLRQWQKHINQCKKFQLSPHELYQFMNTVKKFGFLNIRNQSIIAGIVGDMVRYSLADALDTPEQLALYVTPQSPGISPTEFKSPSSQSSLFSQITPTSDTSTLMSDESSTTAITRIHPQKRFNVFISQPIISPLPIAKAKAENSFLRPKA
jgi:hypothetical protein